MHPTPEMPEDPGAPEATDEQNPLLEQSEEALVTAARQSAEVREEAQDSDADPVDDPAAPPNQAEAELLEQLEADLADIDAELAEAENAQAEAASEETVDGAESQEVPAADPVAELTADLQRLNAEYANYRRRMDRDRAEVANQAKAQTVAALLPILDDLAMAATHGDLEEGPLKAFADKFRSTLTGLGLECFGEEGEDFNPDIHEAIQDLSSSDEKAVGTVLRAGYRFKGSLLRTAMVIIGDPVAGPGDSGYSVASEGSEEPSE